MCEKYNINKRYINEDLMLVQRKITTTITYTEKQTLERKTKLRRRAESEFVAADGLEIIIDFLFREC